MTSAVRQSAQRVGLGLLVATPVLLAAVLLFELRHQPPSPRELTAAAMERVLRASVEFAREEGRFPASLNEVPVLMDGVPVPKRDAWGEFIRVNLREDGLFVLQTFGRDMDPGGEGDDHDDYLCAPTRRDDGSLQLEAPDGGPLRFFGAGELTVFELLRGAREVDRRLVETTLEEGLRKVQSVYVVDAWGSTMDVEVVEERLTIRLTAFGPDLEMGGLDDLVARRSYAPGDDGGWWLLEGQEAPRPLVEVDRENRGDDS